MTSKHKWLNAFSAFCALCVVAVFSSAAFAQSRGNAGGGSGCGPAGYVHEVTGAGTIKPVAAKEAPTKAGDVFESETIFRTGADEKMILKFADGQVVALGPDSALRIGRYCYVAGDLRQSTSSMELLRGEMRVVTGLIGETNREAVRITAGNSTLGILKPGGADFIVKVNPEPEEVGAAVVARGEVSVRTPYGPIYRIEAGQYVPWEPGRTPPPPLPIAAAPAVIQAAVADLWATVVPVNTPVAVAASARTAALVAGTNAAQTIAGVDPKLAGYVDAVSNSVSINTAAGKTGGAAVGTTFAAGTVINTGADGRAVLKFADGQVVVLGPNSTLKVDQYQFDPRDIKTSKSDLDLTNGAMRLITGSIQAENHEGISITAGKSIIGILNTGPADFVVVVNTKEQEVGVARVAIGEISVHTPYGPIDKIKVEQSSLWGPRNTPDTPLPVGTSLALVQAAVSLQLSGLPENNPVGVQSAAAAASATAAAERAQAAANANPTNTQLQAAAQAATERAAEATQTANAASQAIAAAMFASALTALPATAAGPAVAQIPSAPALAAPTPIVTPTATPGAGGGCLGSKC